MTINRFILTMVALVGILSGLAWGRCENIKWDQPPEKIGEFQGLPVYYGWDQYSVWDPDQPFIAAADWKCDDCAPVKDIHFWGSIFGWLEPEIPPGLLPDAFRFTFWTDVPVGHDPRYPDVWWSHPGYPIHEVDVRNYNWEFDGWDVDVCEPGGPGQWNIFEATYRFDVVFDPDDCFFQEPGNIYWVSIGAVYDNVIPVEQPWGWKTRPWEPWMIDYGVTGGPEVGTPFPFEWWPLEDPCGGAVRWLARGGFQLRWIHRRRRLHALG